MSQTSTIYAFVPATLLLTAFAGCSAPSVSAREASFPGDFPDGVSLLVRPASLDVHNLHLPAVMVSPSVSDLQEDSPLGFCSGVLIRPRVVVTAAHCFCRSRALASQDELPPVMSRRASGVDVVTRARALQGVIVTEITDKSSPCVQDANISTVVYEPSQPGRKPIARVADESGRVWIHPEFEMIFGTRQGRKGLVWSNADLAVVVLEQPVRLDFRPVALSEFEVKIGDALVMVGYGLGEPKGKQYGLRQFGENRVTRILYLETGSVVFGAVTSPGPDDKEPSHAGLGDSGGPVVRKDDPNILIGIISMSAQTVGGTKMSLFTSVYPDRQWLLDIIRRVELETDAGVDVLDAGSAPSPTPGTR